MQQRRENRRDSTNAVLGLQRIETAQKTVEIPQLQYRGWCPVLGTRLLTCPSLRNDNAGVETVQKTVEVPQFVLIDKGSTFL